jgi:hypothetical protein
MAQSYDSIKFTIASEETVVNDTVKIVANISGMVDTESTEKTLKDSIREMMERFISNVKWQFAGMTRTAHESGWEQINLVASARVPESENRNLDNRRKDVSTRGLSISRVTSDVSFPAILVEQTEQKLRLDIIRKAREQCTAISSAMDRMYWIKKIDYIGEMEQPAYSNSRPSASSASMKTSYGSGFGGSALEGQDDSLGNAQKFTMIATVTLATATAAQRQ